MANKYQITHIRDCIVERLESDWPQTIHAWDALEGEVERSKEHSNTLWYIDDRFPEPASAIRLARDYGIPSILPAAFYQLSRLKIANDHARRRKEANTFYDYDYDERTARWDLLSGEDLLCVMRGQEKLREVALHLPRRVMCPNPDWSKKCNVKAMIHQLNKEYGIDTTTDFLEHFRHFGVQYREDRYDSGRNICDPCDDTVESLLDDIREEIWMKLPEYFELGNASGSW